MEESKDRYLVVKIAAAAVVLVGALFASEYLQAWANGAWAWLQTVGN